MAYWLSNFRLFVGVIVFLFVFFLVYDRTRPHHRTMAKIFHTSLTDSHRVVQNVLDEKGLPYKMYGSDRFLIESEVEIKLSKFRAREGLIEGTTISLTPKTPESQQLIFSLRQKLDDAFRPRGL